MEVKTLNKKAFTLVEMMVSMLIIAFIAGYAWKIYSNSGETMRHTVSQSQIQADIRGFLDNLETEMMTCYSFDTIDTDKKKFSFYCFTYSKQPLDDILYDGDTLKNTGPDSDAKIKVKKIEYSWENGIVTKKRTPGWLYFLQRPIKFEASTSNAFDATDKAMTKEELRDISEFEVKGYLQELNGSPEDKGLKIAPVKTEESYKAAFIVLRLHTHKDEGAKRRDEEIDIVNKFYSTIRIANLTNVGYFSTTDIDGSF